jgi:hypothetical protein
MADFTTKEIDLAESGFPYCQSRHHEQNYRQDRCGPNQHEHWGRRAVDIRSRERISDEQNSPWPKQNRNGQKYTTLPAQVPCPSNDSGATAQPRQSADCKDRSIVVSQVQAEVCRAI